MSNIKDINSPHKERLENVIDISQIICLGKKEIFIFYSLSERLLYQVMV